MTKVGVSTPLHGAIAVTSWHGFMEATSGARHIGKQKQIESVVGCHEKESRSTSVTERSSVRLLLVSKNVKANRDTSCTEVPKYKRRFVACLEWEMMLGHFTQPSPLFGAGDTSSRLNFPKWVGWHVEAPSMSPGHLQYFSEVRP